MARLTTTDAIGGFDLNPNIIHVDDEQDTIARALAIQIEESFRDVARSEGKDSTVPLCAGCVASVLARTMLLMTEKVGEEDLATVMEHFVAGARDFARLMRSESIFGGQQKVRDLVSGFASGKNLGDS